MGTSLFDELNDKVKRDPRLTKQNLPRFDLTLLLFNAREALRSLWHAASDEIDRARREGRTPAPALVDAIEAVRPIFGERTPALRP